MFEGRRRQSAGPVLRPRGIRAGSRLSGEYTTVDAPGSGVYIFRSF